jgi:hypothetical protein
MARWIFKHACAPGCEGDLRRPVICTQGARSASENRAASPATFIRHLAFADVLIDDLSVSMDNVLRRRILVSIPFQVVLFVVLRDRVADAVAWPARLSRLQPISTWPGGRQYRCLTEFDARRFNGEKGGDERYVAPFTEALSW